MNWPVRCEAPRHRPRRRRHAGRHAHARRSSGAGAAMLNERRRCVVEPVSTIKAVGKILRIVKYLHERNNAATNRMVEAYDWEKEVAVRDAEQAARLESKFGDRILEIEGVLQALVEDPQFYRVRRNYGFEGAREALDERRRMLTCATAGSITPDLTVAQLARVERTMRELDPDDVKLLNILALTTDADETSGRHVNDRLGAATFQRF